MGDERENMVSFVRGLLDTMPLSSLTQRKVREKYREKYNKTPLNTEQSQLLRNVVLEVASSELSKEAQQKKPSTPTNQNPPKNDKDQDPTVSSTVSTDQPAGQKRPLESKKETPDSKKQKVQEIESDDDCVVVECRQADILPHCRADCPVEPYSFTENVKIGAFENNAKYCDKCFCYICDVKASECKFWNTPREPHCNANSKAPCWKARRMVNNQVKFAFIQRYESLIMIHVKNCILEHCISIFNLIAKMPSNQKLKLCVLKCGKSTSHIALEPNAMLSLFHATVFVIVKKRHNIGAQSVDLFTI